MTRQLVERVKQSPDRPALAPFAVLKVKCPKCGAGVQEDLRRFHCEKCDFAIWKRMPGRLLQASEVEELIAKRTVGPLQGFLSRQKRRFAAVLRLTEQFKVEFDFARNGNGDKPAAATPDFSGQEPLGACPRCGSRVFDNDLNYACEKAVGLQPGCAFRLSKVILKRPLDRAQVQKLLAEGKTDLLDNFISKRGRPFAAYLARTESGEVKFEFEKRAPAGKPAGPKEREAKPAGAEQRPGEPVGQCPLCGAKVLETRTTYECEKRNDKTTPCKFRVGRLILQQPIDRAQLARLLSDKRTELLSGFVSKFGRPFPAYLVLSRDGRVGFEFPDRANPD
jgi:DNA topoisomerase-3